MFSPRAAVAALKALCRLSSRLMFKRLISGSRDCAHLLTGPAAPVEGEDIHL